MTQNAGEWRSSLTGGSAGQSNTVCACCVHVNGLCVDVVIKGASITGIDAQVFAVWCVSLWHVSPNQIQTPTPGTADVMLMPPPSLRPPSNLPAATPPQVGSVPPHGYFSNPNTPHQFSVPSPAVFTSESSGIEPQLQ